MAFEKMPFRCVLPLLDSHGNADCRDREALGKCGKSDSSLTLRVGIVRRTHSYRHVSLFTYPDRQAVGAAFEERDFEPDEQRLGSHRIRWQLPMWRLDL